jgi:hypothetical protein
MQNFDRTRVKSKLGYASASYQVINRVACLAVTNLGLAEDLSSGYTQASFRVQHEWHEGRPLSHLTRRSLHVRHAVRFRFRAAESDGDCPIA